MTAPLSSSRLLKTLSPNDLGLTRTHQSGIHIPKALVWFFPPLEDGTLNPDRWLTLERTDGGVTQCRYIHYNGRVLGINTRDEYRITWIPAVLREMNAQVGDLLSFELVGENRYRVELLQAEPAPSSDRIVIVLGRGWKTVSLRR